MAIFEEASGLGWGKIRVAADSAVPGSPESIARIAVGILRGIA
jgi:hypothetical protein